ncbi:Zn-dependent hydrolase [Limnobaculum parvum]|uniref:Zn-dependent hydrolase n=1 Tax=Limnobaculum parvum TaxID=2172103 RepID=A0A2Y9TU56_9GAMM|nr:Zn-dependent hydrolase [Limnobaculum parvum]AWH87176.1 Zn-dependent hydrolase [Limnobaculum parvum]
MVQALTKQSALDLFEQITTFSVNDSTPGITRLAYSKEDEQAHKLMMDKIQQMGLQVRQDSMGNIFARLPGKNPELPAIGTGSHIDSVPQGGAYDGVIGVIAGLYAISQFKPQQLKRSLELVIFRAEESSRFGFACMASKVMSGQADVDKWAKNTDSEGNNIFQVLDNCGYQSQKLDECRLPANYFDAFIETHIEQGKVLEHQHKRIGVVNGIAAPCRYRVEVHGHADHSGATPMSQRHDALVASAAIITDINAAACYESTYGTVGTVGRLDVTPNAINVIPGDVTFYVDIRGVDKASVNRVVAKFLSSIEHAKAAQDVVIHVSELANDMPVLMKDEIVQRLERICQEHSVPYVTMMSGAGHDTMYMAKDFPAGMLFIPSKEGVSHHPDEYSEFEDVILAAEILRQAMGELADA